MFGNGEHGLYENNVFISFLLIYFSLSIGKQFTYFEIFSKQNTNIQTNDL